MIKLYFLFISICRITNNSFVFKELYRELYREFYLKNFEMILI